MVRRLPYFDLHGDIQANSVCQEGVYHDGTRFLSHLTFKVGPTRPFLLNSNVQQDNVLLVANLTNPDIYQAGKVIMPRGILHITRTKMLWQATCYETLQFSNYGLSSIEGQFSIEYRCDFADLFEVRPPRCAAGGYALATTVGDLARFLDTLLAGRLFRHRATLKEMLTIAPAQGEGGLVGYGLRASSSAPCPAAPRSSATSAGRSIAPTWAACTPRVRRSRWR